VVWSTRFCFISLGSFTLLRFRCDLLSFHCLVLYVHSCCNMVRWAWWDWELTRWLTTVLQCSDEAGWDISPVKLVNSTQVKDIVFASLLVYWFASVAWDTERGPSRPEPGVTLLSGQVRARMICTNAMHTSSWLARSTGRYWPDVLTYSQPNHPAAGWQKTWIKTSGNFINKKPSCR